MFCMFNRLWESSCSRPPRGQGLGLLEDRVHGSVLPAGRIAVSSEHSLDLHAKLGPDALPDGPVHRDALASWYQVVLPFSCTYVLG